MKYTCKGLVGSQFDKPKDFQFWLYSIDAEPSVYHYLHVHWLHSMSEVQEPEYQESLLWRISPIEWSQCPGLQGQHHLSFPPWVMNGVSGQKKTHLGDERWQGICLLSFYESRQTPLCLPHFQRNTSKPSFNQEAQLDVGENFIILLPASEEWTENIKQKQSFQGEGKCSDKSPSKHRSSKSHLVS